MIGLVLFLVLVILVLAGYCYRENYLRKSYEKEFYDLRKEVWDLRQENVSLHSRLSRKGIKMPKREKK